MSLEDKLDRIIEQQDKLIKLLKTCNEQQHIQLCMSEKYYECHTNIHNSPTRYRQYRLDGIDEIKKN